MEKGENCRESSVRNWKSTGTNEDINSGSFQRMADALEATNNLNRELLSKVLNTQYDNLRKIKSLTTQVSTLKKRIKHLESLTPNK